MFFNSAFGGVAAYKAKPFQQAAAKYYVLFRKSWMKVPIRLFAFGAVYYSANQLQTRLFPRMYWNYYIDGGMKDQIYLANTTLSKFRLFDGEVANADAPRDIESYLDVYQNGPLTKAEMLNRFNNGREVDENYAKNFQIKRSGKDKDDIFWEFGKLHGLENIVYVDPDEAAACMGDPVQMQILLNKACDAKKPLPPQSYDKMVEEIHKSMA